VCCWGQPTRRRSSRAYVRRACLRSQSPLRA
jgi:hypothetical protein